MKISRVSLITLALAVSACAADKDPTQDVRAAAEAARQANLKGPAPAPAKAAPNHPCSVSIVNGEPHNPLANLVLDEVPKAIQSSETLHISNSDDADLELRLFKTQRADQRSTAWDELRSLDTAPGAFYVAYVILDTDRRYLAGDFIQCRTTYRECGERMAQRALRICQGSEA